MLLKTLRSVLVSVPQWIPAKYRAASLPPVGAMKPIWTLGDEVGMNPGINSYGVGITLGPLVLVRRWQVLTHRGRSFPRPGNTEPQPGHPSPMAGFTACATLALRHAIQRLPQVGHQHVRALEPHRYANEPRGQCAAG